MAPVLFTFAHLAVLAYASERGAHEAALQVHADATIGMIDGHEPLGAAAEHLLQLGIGRGDRVALWSVNNYEWVVAQFATARIGLILVNINPAYRAAELEFALAQVGVQQQCEPLL